jgi:hypothetical protein|nr:MAG TPA: hypothetical protein [Crassvirales sp.]
MNNITIDRTIIEKHHLTLDEFLYLLCYSNHIDITKGRESLRKKNLLCTNLLGEVEIDRTLWSAYEDIIVEADKAIATDEDELSSLAKELKDLFPKGRKDGTSLYWAESVPLIVRRLKSFFKRYGKKESDVILEATKRYVNFYSMKGTAYMRVLKYFIFKEDVDPISHEVVYTSDLLNEIENPDSSDSYHSFLKEV